MRMSQFINRRTVLAGTALSSALVLSACGSSASNQTASHSSGMTATASPSYGPAATGAHNAADVTFATGMIPHHAQAMDMAAMAPEQCKNAKVRELATAIESAQDPEIKTMSGWLVGWGGKAPDTSSHSMPAMGGSDASMNGMMSATEMQHLSKANGATFDRLWVQLMTKHHQGAVEMARTELAHGQNAEAKALATQIIKAQTTEIATMTALAKTLPA